MIYPLSMMLLLVMILFVLLFIARMTALYLRNLSGQGVSRVFNEDNE